MNNLSVLSVGNCAHSHAFCKVRKIRSLFDTRVHYYTYKTFKIAIGFFYFAKGPRVSAIINTATPTPGPHRPVHSTKHRLRNCVHSQAFCKVQKIRSLFDTQLDYYTHYYTIFSHRIFRTLQKALEGSQ